MQLGSLVLLAATALADKVYFANNQDLDRTGKITLYSVDTATQALSEVTSWENNHYTFGATVCKNTYYGYWTDLPSQTSGLVGVDLATKNVTIYDTDVLYHALGCDSTNSSQLFGVGSVPGQNGAIFTFRTFDLSSGTDNEGATLPAVGFIGFDDVFTFTQDGSKLYGAGTEAKAIQKSYQYIFDTKTQQVTYGPTQYPTGQTPYTVFPDTSPITGWVNSQFGHQLSTFTFGDKISVKHKANMDKYFNDIQMPICGDTFYVTSQKPNPDWQLWGVSASTGKEAFSMDLKSVPASSEYFIGGVACVRS